MNRLSIDELLLELDATQEEYVRRKLSIGGYALWQRKHVEAWLARRDAARLHEQVKTNLVISHKSMFWTKVAALCTLAGVLSSVVAFLR